MQFEASKEKIKDLMKDLLHEDKSFRYQITLKVLLKNDKSNVEIEFRPVYFNTSLYQPLYGSSYVNLPVEQLHSRKRLKSIKKKDFKCFLWCHVRAINLVKRNPKKITKHDKKLLINYIILALIFLCKKMITKKNEERFGIFVNVLVMKVFAEIIH